MNINIEDLTLGQLREIKEVFKTETLRDTTNNGALDDRLWNDLIGKNIIIRTVTMIYTGELLSVTSSVFVLKSCSWIPETARYSDFVANGSVNECEPYPEELFVYISRGAVVDVCELKADLPRNLK